MTTYVLGGGCFWCLDGVYAQIKGVMSVESGYAGGDEAASYWDVVNGSTGHAEVVRVTFDESIIPSDTVLDIFFLIHDPTSLNQQGADKGPQYRSTMMYQSEEVHETFIRAASRAQDLWPRPIVTEVMPLKKFYLAEAEHQDFYRQNPQSGYCTIVIDPKVAKAREKYAEWFHENTA